MTLVELSKVTGESITNLSRWLSGKRKITLEKADEIERKTGIPKDVFLDIELQKVYFKKGFRNEEVRSN